MNIRCLDTLEPKDFKIQSLDGRNWEERVDTIR